MSDTPTPASPTPGAGAPTTAPTGQTPPAPPPVEGVPPTAPADGGAPSDPLAGFLKDGKVLGKFAYDPENPLATLVNVAKSYSEIEKMQGKPKPAAPRDASGKFQPKAPESGLAIQDLPDDMTASQFVESVGLNPADIVSQWQEHGQLTPEQYAAFKKKGLPKGVVDNHMKAEVYAASAAKAQIRAEAAAMVGGEDQLETLLSFAGTLPKETQQTINQLLANPASVKHGIRLIMAEHTEAVNGAAQPGKLIEPGSMPPSVSGGAFTSTRELQNARAEAAKKYGDAMQDPAFRARLEKTPHNIRTGW